MDAILRSENALLLDFKEARLWSPQEVVIACLQLALGAAWGNLGQEVLQEGQSLENSEPVEVIYRRYEMMCVGDIHRSGDVSLWMGCMKGSY